MKIVLCVHGYPPDLIGGTERSAQGLAQALLCAGHEVLVVAGSIQPAGGAELRRVETIEQGVRVVRLLRPDLYFDHWHKSRSVRVNAAFRELLVAERPDVVHVLHWLRLSRELVLCAAREGVPSVVSLNDHWTSCLLCFRVDPKTRTACERPLSALACIACAKNVPPRTPWVPLEAAFMEFAKREADLARELDLARSILVPTRAHATSLSGFVAGLELEKVRIAPPAAPPAALPAVDEAAAPPPLVVLYFGALSELKGVDLLIEAAADERLRAAVELRLAGREERPGWLEQQAQRLPAVRMTYLGEYTPDQLFEPAHPLSEAARQSHVFVTASRAPESFGLVLDEARALGLPAVLPRLGAFAERGVEGQGVLFFEPGDAGSLAAVLAGLVAAPGELASLRASVPAACHEVDLLEVHLQAYAEALEAGAPGAGEDDWYADRMALFAEGEWDRGLAGVDPGELGFGG